MNTYQHQSTQADQRRAQLLGEAEAHRLSQTVEQFGMTDRLLATVGEWMVTEGTRLKKRQKPTVASSKFRMGNVEG